MDDLNSQFDSVPGELKNSPQWVVWRREEQKKTPYSATTGCRTNAHDTTAWLTFNQAVLAFSKGGYTGIGHVFAEQDPFAGVDIDDCLDPSTGEFTDESAKEAVQLMNSYTEISPSGTGVKIWVKATKRYQGCKFKVGGCVIEFYNRGRYFTVTGRHLAGTPTSIEERDEVYNALLGRVGAEKIALAARQAVAVAQASGLPAHGRNENEEEISQEVADLELMERARHAANGDRFSALYDGIVMRTPGFDHSRADAQLCSKLAFWAKEDGEETVDRLFRQSGLMRPKWDEKHGGEGQTYGEMTIRAAMEWVRTHGGFHRSDMFKYSPLGNAQRLVQRYRDEIRYCAGLKSWYRWTGTHWAACESNHELMQLAKETVRRLYCKLEMLRDDEKKGLFKFILSSETVNGLEGMVKLAESEEGVLVSTSQFDTHLWKLNFQNGTLDLKTGVLWRHDPHDLLTVCLPFKYDPKAVCPKWEKFLEWAIPNPDTRTFIHRAIGYTLAGVIREHALFFLHGGGRNGKSTFTGVLEKLLAPYWAKSRADMLMASRWGEPHRGATPELAKLRGKRLVTVSEVQQGCRLDEAKIKDLTGGDALTGRPLYVNDLTFQPTHKMWMCGNYRPEIRGTDLGIRRRVKLVPFDQHLEAAEVDTALPDKLAEELSGIMAWAVRGCLEWQKAGLGDAEEIAGATADYFAENDTVGVFLEECCGLLPGMGDFSSNVYARYKAWCKESSEEPIAHRTFSSELKRRGYEIKRDTTTGRQKFVSLMLRKGPLAGPEPVPESGQEPTDLFTV